MADGDIKKVELQIEGREQLSLEVHIGPERQVIKASLTGLGGWDFLRLLQATRQSLKGPIDSIVLPQGSWPGALLLREAILKIQGRWAPPYQEEELCHCRGVSTKKVDCAILAGAHTSKKVSEQTSASTACGTCRPNVEAMIRHRVSF